MKLIKVITLASFFSLNAHSAVGWFYNSQIDAIKDAISTWRPSQARGSSIEVIYKTAKGFKVLLTSGCQIDLIRKNNKRSAPGYAGPIKFEYKINTRYKASGCK